MSYMLNTTEAFAFELGLISPQIIVIFYCYYLFLFVELYGVHGINV